MFKPGMCIRLNVEEHPFIVGVNPSHYRDDMLGIVISVRDMFNSDPWPPGGQLLLVVWNYDNGKGFIRSQGSSVVVAVDCNT